MCRRCFREYAGDIGFKKVSLNFFCKLSLFMNGEDIPSELSSCRQQQLILFTGLDIINNPTHAAVFSCFTHNRTSDRAPLRILMLSADHSIYTAKDSKAKPPKSPRGFIKISWLSKYVTEVPAVIVLFADLDWNHPSWNEKVTECESKVSSLRTSVGGRGTRICVVLLQRANSFADSDQIAPERAAKLCQSCQLPQKQLFVFPFVEQLHGYVIRLEAAFHELAQGFYQQLMKNIRARSTPNSFPNLIVRQQFKLAFISELWQDTHSALRHYKLGYQHCAECEVADSDLYELRQVAGLLNYKICQLSFMHSTALEAITQQRRHASLFFSASPGTYPSVELAKIEFALWKSKQCGIFADLFEYAISMGLAGVSTQNPGLYLQAAASYRSYANDQILALKFAKKDELSSVNYPQPDPLIPEKPLVFYGQRPWHVLLEEDSTADATTEKNAQIALEMRCAPEYSQNIHLLSAAMLHHRKYKCSRMYCYVMLLMANEYTASNLHDKALQLTSHVLWEKQLGGFNSAVATVLSKTLLSAYFLADVKEFISATIQMLNIHKYSCFANITSYLYNNMDLLRHGLSPLSPLPSLNMSESQLALYQQQWSRLISDRIFFTINCARLETFVRVRAAFLHNKKEIYSKSFLMLMVVLLSHTSVTVTFDKLRVSICDSKAAKDVEQLNVFEFTTENVELLPDVEKVFFFKISLLPVNFQETKTLFVNSLTLEIGSIHSPVFGTFDWDSQSLSTNFSEYGCESYLDNVGLTEIQVKPRDIHCRLEGCLESDALLGEIAVLSLVLISEEEEMITYVKWN
uniref:Foie-gras_1 domain-containing protein n=1 Tax=Syphacia muris TaxID=451379 RepID=A0A0N5AA08_9BILA